MGRHAAFAQIGRCRDQIDIDIAQAPGTHRTIGERCDAKRDVEPAGDDVDPFVGQIEVQFDARIRLQKVGE